MFSLLLLLQFLELGGESWVAGYFAEATVFSGIGWDLCGRYFGAVLEGLP